MISSSAHRPVVLIILDGWGIGPKGPGNAISLAKTPNIINYWNSYPHGQLQASGEAVGLPRGEAGNTMVGHMNIGAGYIVYQDLPRINMSIADGSFFRNFALNAAINHTHKNHSALHLMGLVGAGGVHSNIEHLSALIYLAKDKQVKKLYIHAFTDGRDSPPTASRSYLNHIQTEIDKLKLGRIATIIGRYYAMDRDRRWSRTEKAYRCLVYGEGKSTPNWDAAIKSSYKSNLTDEFIEPIVIGNPKQINSSRIKDNDAVIFFNYRVDRPRQLTKAFVLPQIGGIVSSRRLDDPYSEKYYGRHIAPPAENQAKINRGKLLENLSFVTMTEYEKGLPTQVAYPPPTISNPFSKVISDNNLTQLHVAETEKERFVTYYIDGLRNDPAPGEKWVIVPSKRVPTYDLTPTMSASEITSVVIQAIKQELYDFILLNLANPDMVGHTGSIPAAIKGIETVDHCLGQIVSKTLEKNGICLITADHGNAETMLNPITGGISTEHTANPVPFIVVLSKLKNNRYLINNGILPDIGPTVLAALNIPPPPEMTAKNLLSNLALYES